MRPGWVSCGETGICCIEGRGGGAGCGRVWQGRGGRAEREEQDMADGDGWTSGCTYVNSPLGCQHYLRMERSFRFYHLI